MKLLPTRSPGAALNAAVAVYTLDSVPLYPADELLIGRVTARAEGGGHR